MASNYDVVHTVEYAVNTLATDQLFIPGNQAEGDNPDSGTMAQRKADCVSLSPNGIAVQG